MGIQLFPLNFNDLEQAAELRKQCVQGAASRAAGGAKRSRDDVDADDSANRTESSYLLLSAGSTMGARDHHHHDRTGRWSTEEIAYVDQLVAGFDKGVLPLPHGIKLNEFLGDMLLCKSSRLTKKMKNAKLSTRSFTLKNDRLTDEQYISLTKVQDEFLQAVPSDAMQLELKFNITKLWRTHFSNLCLQIGYEFLDGRDWLLSLEELERRASEAEETMRVARRRRMGLALRQDIGPTSNVGVFIGGMPAKRDNIAPPVAMSSEAATVSIKPTPMKPEVAGMDPFYFLDDHHAGASQGSRTGTHQRRFSEECSMVMLEELMGAAGSSSDNPFPRLRDCGPFLDNVIHYLENNHLSFEHADVWVPSFSPDTKNGSGETSADSLRLYHAGHATRSDIDSGVASQLREYGAYSTNFSFAPGVGLPGRVYTANTPSWECRVNDADPARFERAGGAQVYGVKTAVGIPLEAPMVGRVVVAIYSTSEIEEDPYELQRFVNAFSQWTPMPKWSLEIDVGQFEQQKQGAESNQDSAQSVSSDVAMQTLNAMPNTFYPFNGQDAAAAALVGLTSQALPQTLPQTSTVSVNDDRDVKIATILGDHMPGNQDDSMLQHFMSLRLLLLRPHDRRSEEENDLLDIVKRSYTMYSESKKRSGGELASLLARDWMFLSASSKTPTQTPVTAPQPQQQQIQYTSLPPPMLPKPAAQPMHWFPAQAALPPPNSLPGMQNGDSSKQLLHWQHSSPMPSSFLLANSNETNRMEQPPHLEFPRGISNAATLVPKSPRD
ncbi:hypothetical protein MHU86_19454 [Fragilaria crotonensis]|nr:hypothetical protein MHU86_19454 [Fragilaria crotonensis]